METDENIGETYAIEEVQQGLESVEVLVSNVESDPQRHFRCMYCGAMAANEKKMREHVASHGKSIVLYPCQYCNCIFRTAEAKKEHMLSHVAADDTAVAMSPKEQEVEPETVVEEAETLVYVPQVASNEIVKYLQVEVATEEVSLWDCECGFHGGSEEAVKNHLQQTKGRGATCGVCQVQCPNSCALRIHLREHRDTHSGLYPCKLCMRSFSSRNMLVAHRVEHEDMMLPCDMCNAHFSGRTGLYLHKRRMHENRRDFKCKYCGKGFTFRGQRDIHERVHTNERPFICGVCGATFKALSGLHVHRKTHTDERPFECQFCGKRLRLNYNLKLHLRTHTGEKPYICKVCGRGFAQPGDCKKHEKTHLRHIKAEPT